METNAQDAPRKVSGMALDGRWFPASRIGLALLLCILLATTSGRARGEEADRITILEENDSLFFNSDKHYTQGLRISDLPFRDPGSGGSVAQRLPGPRQCCPGLRARRYAPHRHPSRPKHFHAEKSVNRTAGSA